MLKIVNKLAKLAVVSSTLVVLGITAVMPVAHAAGTGFTDAMYSYCKTYGFAGVGYGYTPGSQFTSTGKLISGTGQYGYFCANPNSNGYRLIPKENG